jgi:hypothetical protein
VAHRQRCVGEERASAPHSTECPGALGARDVARAVRA